MSLLLIRWDEKAKRVFMTGAWHEYLMIYKHKQNKTFKIKSGWVALGMIQNISKLLKEKEIRFEPNDIIVLYSDWITEAINKTKKDGSEEMFWEERLIESINNAPIVDNQKYKSARSVFNNITIDLSQFMWYKHSQFDDITLAVLHYKDQDFSKVNNFSEEIKEDFITEWNW
jgi:serine phosphatase RsbU (regulator of sigma subunit)